MLGSLFALLAAATFAWTNAAARRGVVSGSVAQAIVLSVPVGLPIFGAALLLTGHPSVMLDLTPASIVVFAIVGITHFIAGRYCNYRALKAIGANLAGPVMQLNLLVTLTLAVLLLGETLTPLRIIGILLILSGPTLTHERASTAKAQQPQRAVTSFTPKYVEGYLFALLAALFYGASPALVRYGVDGHGLSGGLAGGVIASASGFILTLPLLLWPRRMREFLDMPPGVMKWFMLAGVMVYISQVFVYMALSMAPASVVSPITGMALLFRIHFSRWLNPDHEVFGSKIILGTIVSFAGVVVLSSSTDAALASLGLRQYLPDSWAAVLLWHW